LVWAVKAFAGSLRIEMLSLDVATKTINMGEHMVPFPGACLLINPFVKGTV
jgi:hypothetical protein